MRFVSSEVLTALQRNPKNIRHICILAHVDHGKTTFADSILASNGIISQKMAGKLRYMDSRKDEQERGITMKSSSVSIYYQRDDQHFLVNLIDSPGHVDFAGEVCTAVRLCDGALILVDVVEGICPQTKVALQQAWIEHIKPLLVFNKIDRLITEWKLSPLDAHAHLLQLLEQVNALMGEFFASDVLKKGEANGGALKTGSGGTQQVFNWDSGLDDSDDSSVYFLPENGNVIFASAIDGWGFGISHFAKLFAAKVGTKEEILLKTLWGDFYLNSKTKQILKGASAKAKKPLFVQLILENIWALYDAVLVQRDSVAIEKMVKSLNLTIAPRDVNHRDPKICLQAILGQWLPLSKAALGMVCDLVPSPYEISEEKVEGLMCASTVKFESLPEETRLLKKDFKACSSSEDVPVIVCVSKMFPVEKKFLPENRQKPLTAEEIALRREKARQRLAEKAQQRLAEKAAAADSSENTSKPPETNAVSVNASEDVPTDEDDASNTVFVAFARIYSGCLTRGQQLYVLGPKHDPAKALSSEIQISDTVTVHDLLPEQHITLATVKSLYLLMGKELVEIENAPAGNVVGIGGLHNHVLKSATLSSTIACPSFVDLHSSTVPIVRIALEPVHPREMPALVRGLRLLNQADPCVQVYVQESGEHVLVTAGEVHLQRCIDDLKQSFAKIDINVSAPIVPFRETIILPPKVDMVNEAIEKAQPKKTAKTEKDEGDELCSADGSVTLWTANKLSFIRMKAKPLPPDVTKLLEASSDLMRVMDQFSMTGSKDSLTAETLLSIRNFKDTLSDLFTKAGPEWSSAVDSIWCFGPRRCGPNILLNSIPSYQRPSIWCKKGNSSSDSLHFNYDSSFMSGFQLASLCGPLCDEPMMGVCFVVEDWGFEKAAYTPNTEDCEVLNADGKSCATNAAESAVIPDSVSVASSGPSSASSTPFGPFTGQIMSTVKEACKKAFQAQPQRLMAAMYSCSIQVTGDVLGKMYAVLGRRHGRVLHADMQEGSPTFHVSAELPVIESFDFALEIRRKTSGLVALPQLIFTHWEVVDVDPFWEPSTEEEYLHFGEKADSENRARKYMNDVRRRKGLSVDEKIVEHAEKQRTLNKKK